VTIQQAQFQVEQWIKTHGLRYFNELTNMAILTEEVGLAVAQTGQVLGMSYPACFPVGVNTIGNFEARPTLTCLQSWSRVNIIDPSTTTYTSSASPNYFLIW
jgi:hypothetical protein